MAVRAVVKLAKDHGALVARQILQAIADAGILPIKAVHIRAAEVLMRDKEYAAHRISLKDLTDVIARCADTEDFESRTLAAAMNVPQYKALTMYWFRRRSRTPIPRKPEAKPQPAPSEWIG
jgi:hypothetical protein